ncbi:NlpC/P60 family protein [Dactylosporangium sp. NPDC048998]|uniref:C40 family peptidase n=1 Tax=Dactylosporangium sp. NPDC048998 TaxID=3363976 RepID=UPI00371C0D3B
MSLVKVVRVAVATVWSDPDARTADTVVTQLLLGDPVVVDEVRGDWARVVATGQPAPSLDPRGYPGWLPTGQLTDASTMDDGPSSVVDALATGLRAAPGGAVVVPGVTLGTRLAPAGPPVGGWLPVRVAGHPDPFWVPDADVRPVPAGPPSGEQALEVARRLLGVPYVWGGLTPAGIDCSGLVHLAWRRLGVRLPRDAHEQAEATEPLPPGRERPGDLYFFARPGHRIHHVGFVADSGRMLHACGDARGVVEEGPTPGRVATQSGARRVS